MSEYSFSVSSLWIIVNWLTNTYGPPPFPPSESSMVHVPPKVGFQVCVAALCQPITTSLSTAPLQTLKQWALRDFTRDKGL